MSLGKIGRCGIGEGGEGGVLNVRLELSAPDGEGVEAILLIDEGQGGRGGGGGGGLAYSEGMVNDYNT